MFEKTFIASQRGANVKWTLATLPLAVLAHAAALGAVTLGQIWAVAELSEPPLQVTFYQAAPPPPPPPPPPKAVAAPKVVQPVAQQQVVQPLVVPEKLPEMSTGPENTGVEGSIEGVDDGGGRVGVPGIPGGVGTGPGVLSDRQRTTCRLGSVERWCRRSRSVVRSRSIRTLRARRASRVW